MAKYEYGGRTSLSRAAVKRHVDALRLQAQGRWRGAMYLAGYSVECKLKVRLMEMHNLHTLAQLDTLLHRRYGVRTSVFTHSIEFLFDLTGARQRLMGDPRRSSLQRAFIACNHWRPAWRYKPDDGSEAECAKFMESVAEFARFVDKSL